MPETSPHKTTDRSGRTPHSSIEFHCDRLAIGQYAAQRILNAKLGSSVDVIPGLGGTVHQLRLLGGTALLASDATEELNANPLFRGRLLFPFCDRLPGGRYSFAGKQYEIKLSPTNQDCDIHGFAHSQALRVVREVCSNANGQLTLSLPANQVTQSGYPFKVDLLSNYLIDDQGFELGLRADNCGKTAAPVAFGWHPYFLLHKDARLVINSECFVEVDSNLIPTGNTPSVNGSPYDFRAGKLVSSFASLDIGLRAPEDGRTTLMLGDFTLTIQQDVKVFPFIQLYLAPDQNSLAIEPVAGVANCFNQRGLGGHILQPSQSIEGKVRIAVSN